MSEKMDKKALKKKKKKKSMVMKSVILILLLVVLAVCIFFLAKTLKKDQAKYTETGYGAESGWRRCYG